MKNFTGMLGTFSALFLSFIAAGAQNPGTYFIVNSFPSADKLAATYQGSSQSDVIVTGLQNSADQKWILTSGKQLKPFIDQSKAATAKNNDLVVTPNNNFVWTILNAGDGTFAISIDAEESRVWDIGGDVTVNSKVILMEKTDSITQNWFLELAP